MQAAIIVALACLCIVLCGASMVSRLTRLRSAGLDVWQCDLAWIMREVGWSATGIWVAMIALAVVVLH